ncbi:hypothetical protein FHW96_004830, partial [Novosphingobium sp. SG751A]|nr:hypothetical protein [Novosphingobium sp. SG751A]
WIKHLRGDNGPVDDPRAQELAQAATGEDAIQAIFGVNGLMTSDWPPIDQDIAAIKDALSL